MKIKTALLLPLLALALAPLVVHADADSEREALAKISNELQRLSAMVADSSKQSDPASRVQFRFDWLAKDIELVKRGVDDHLDSPRQPRPVEALKGEYRR